MARLKGNQTPLLTFKVGAGSAVDLGTYAVNVSFDDGESDPVTFSDYATGSGSVAMTVEFVTDFASSAAFDYLFTNAGAAGVTWVFQPVPGTVSQDKPKFTGTCTLPRKPYVAMEAGNEDQTFEVTIQCDTYTKVIV